MIEQFKRGLSRLFQDPKQGFRFFLVLIFAYVFLEGTLTIIEHMSTFFSNASLVESALEAGLVVLVLMNLKRIVALIWRFVCQK